MIKRIDLDGSSNEINKLLEQYKSLIDFKDKTQKDNYKWIESFIKYQNKKHPEEDSTEIIKDAIDIHIKCFMNRK
jgi:hypothetical protein